LAGITLRLASGRLPTLRSRTMLNCITVRSEDERGRQPAVTRKVDRRDVAHEFGFRCPCLKE